MKSFIAKASLAFVLFIPALPAFQDHDRNAQQSTQRYYDKQSKQYREWNDNENQAYQRYARETHHENREFSRLSDRDRQKYFKWRHDHPDDEHRDDHR